MSEVELKRKVTLKSKGGNTPPPPKKTKWWLWVLLLVAVAAVIFIGIKIWSPSTYDNAGTDPVNTGEVQPVSLVGETQDPKIDTPADDSGPTTTEEEDGAVSTASKEEDASVTAEEKEGADSTTAPESPSPSNDNAAAPGSGKAPVGESTSDNNPSAPKSSGSTETKSHVSTPLAGGLDDRALQVIRGDYGNGAERKQKLGSEYAAIQQRVNEMYRKGEVD